MRWLRASVLMVALCVSCHSPADDDPAETATFTRDFAALISHCERNGDACAEVRYDTETEIISVCRKPDPVFDRQIVTALETWAYPRTFHLIEAGLSRSELAELEGSVLTLLPELEAIGLSKVVPPTTVDGCGSRVVVHSPEPFPSTISDILQEKFGDTVVLGPLIPAL